MKNGGISFLLKKILTLKPLILSVLLFWMIGGNAFIHSHPLFKIHPPNNYEQAAYTQDHDDAQIPICLACISEKTPPNVTYPQIFNVFQSEYDVTVFFPASLHVTPVHTLLSSRSPPEIS
jgi:hypothetical protein